MNKVEDIQRQYYARTASSYDEWHVRPQDEHHTALRYISAFVAPLGISSLLDVGCGTGRGIKYFLGAHPSLKVHGVEPVEALIRCAFEKNFVPPGLIIRGRGESLPYPDRSFDAVCEFGVLHHVRDPSAVVAEMIRVARKAVFLSDENRFAYGTLFSKLAKLCLCKLKLFRAAYLIKTIGRGYRFSPGDGVAFSYSVFDSFDMVADWADTVLLVPTSKGKPNSWHHPLLTSFHVLLCAVNQPGEREDPATVT